MKTNAISATAALAVATWAAHAHAAQPSELAQIQQEIAALRQSYDQRIAALEARLREAEAKATAAANAAVAPPPAAAMPADEGEESRSRMAGSDGSLGIGSLKEKADHE